MPRAILKEILLGIVAVTGKKFSGLINMKITPEILITAYAQGLFPMAPARKGGKLRWYEADPRGVLPLDAFHVPRRLEQKMKGRPFDVTFNKDFAGVIRACADAPRPGAWINEEIIALYIEMHRRGLAHSAEAWKDGVLAGGVYGVAIGGAFFGESMFTAVTDAGKVALVHLVRRLKKKGFILFDTQMVTPATKQFGVVEIPRAEYLRGLLAALEKTTAF
jgi:leucyl/phenylalanyl-tRNA--protein transferase